ncbi:hypothetical protein LJC23_02040 [Desulfovibrio sp. OttesenSCG-928-I05]|nr:hypothetical protein [Desulfovibrio sp. OttesenSCG-928-I05]
MEKYPVIGGNPYGSYSFSVQELENDQLEEEIDNTDDIQGWVQFLQFPFSQITKYYSYFKGESSFGTHQGVKGLQFDRVMTVVDDTEARGNTFNYSRLAVLQYETVDRRFIEDIETIEVKRKDVISSDVTEHYRGEQVHYFRIKVNDTELESMICGPDLYIRNVKNKR